MRRVAAFLSFLAVALLVVAAAPSEAWRGGGSHHGGQVQSRGHFHSGHHFHGRGFVAVGPGFWWGRPYPYWGYYGWPYYAGPYYDPYYAYMPPPVVVEAPQNNVPPAPAAAPERQAYWYYCASAGAYYPTAPTCPEVWIKVPPRSE